jgi:hypothetical protein
MSPTSRFNVWVRAEFPEALGRRFGAIVESVGDPPAELVVERAIYADEWFWDGPSTTPRLVMWTLGTNAVATRLP